jgi:hypothetical protein
MGIRGLILPAFNIAINARNVTAFFTSPPVSARLQYHSCRTGTQNGRVNPANPVPLSRWMFASFVLSFYLPPIPLGVSCTENRRTEIKPWNLIWVMPA